MKTITKLGLYGLSAGIAVIMTGCETPTVEADYVLPARKVVDVSKIDVVTLKVKANVKGNMAGDKAMNETLVRQMLSSRLYKGGYYQVMDDLWGDAEGAERIGKLLAKQVDAGHMYSTFYIGETIPDSEKCPNCGAACTKCESLHKGLEAKAELEVTIDLDLNTKELAEEREFELVTMPYLPVKVKEGMPPISAPNAIEAKKAKQKVPTKVYKTVALGTVTAKLKGVNGKECPVEYSNTFKLPIVKAEKKAGSPQSNLACPSQLEAFAEAISPAIAEIVSDISPYTETRKLVVNENGDARIVTLLRAQAFREAVEFVTELARSGKATDADYENMGIALEAMGRFELALKAFKKAAKFNPEKPSATAQAAVVRVEKILAGNKAVEKSGAKKNVGTQFKAAK